MSGVEAIFGVVTGGAGLVSLGLQLADSAKRLKKMYHTLKDAPKSLQELSFDLETMALSLDLLDQQRQRQGQNCTESIFLRCLATCQQRTQEIQQLVDSMTRRMESRARLRGKLYFAFKDQDVADLFGRLEKAKSSLQMAYAMYQSEVTHDLVARQEKMLLGLQTSLVAQAVAVTEQSAVLGHATDSPDATGSTASYARKRGETALINYLRLGSSPLGQISPLRQPKFSQLTWKYLKKKKNSGKAQSTTSRCFISDQSLVPTLALQPSLGHRDHAFPVQTEHGATIIQRDPFYVGTYRLL